MVWPWWGRHWNKAPERDPRVGRQASEVKVRVSAVVPRKEEILLIRHRRDARSYWVLPGGGLEPGESLMACAIREIREEAGLDVGIQRLLYVCETVPRWRGRHHINLIFLGMLTRPGQSLRLSRHWTIEQPRFIALGDLASLPILPPVADQLVEDFRLGWDVPIRFLGGLWVDLDAEGIE